MELITNLLQSVNNLVWGPGMLVLLLGTGLYLTFRLRFLTFRRIPQGFCDLWRQRKRQDGVEGELSSFNALMTALAATVGTGNIAGVATAIFYGGPGALFWMWCTAMVGMATKFSEVLLAVRYREVTPQGHVVGGAMYYIKNGLGPKWIWMGTLFAVFGSVAGFGIGNTVQANSIADAVNAAFGVPFWVSAVVLLLLVGAVLLGGLQRIGAVAGKIVPFMALFYILAAVMVLVIEFRQIPHLFTLVFSEAFSSSAIEGGIAGSVMWLAIRYGVARGVFSNEAGLGSAPIAHATATVRNPVTQAFIGMLGTFIDTIIICSMTGFAILSTGAWTSGLNGAPMTRLAFETALPGFGGILVTIALCLFAFTTILGWCVYSERCVLYLLGDRALKPFRCLYTLAVPLGAVAKLDLVWLLADTFNALMAIPNLIALLLLSPVVFDTVGSYLKEERKNRSLRPSSPTT